MRYFLAAILLCVSSFAHAVQPSEVLSDPILEDRAREISKDLRCLVCRNENIDESSAQVAGELRILVRERLVAGDSDAQVIDYVVTRYGEYVLLKPTMTGGNRLLWIAGPLMLLIAFGTAYSFVRRRQVEAEINDLTDDEAKRLAALLED